MTRWNTMAILAAAATLGAAATPAGPALVKGGVDAWGRGDYKTAVEDWRGPAVAGDADAEFNLGQAYKLGRGVPLDPAQAQEWFRKAALQGHLQAQDNYGLALFQANKRADAAPWLEKSVARGEPRAQLVLGTMLFNGDGVPRDYPRAYALVTRASQAGLKSASDTLADMDRYISPADREHGTQLAQQYAAQAQGMAMKGGRPMETGAPPPPPPRPVATAVRTPPTVSPAPPPPVARPRPVRETEARSPRPAVGGRWHVQLGAFRDESNARSLWSKIGGRVGGAATYPRAGAMTRLVAGPFASRDDAARACAAAKAAGSACVIVAP